jgi:hypothetical protein
LSTAADIAGDGRDCAEAVSDLPEGFDDFRPFLDWAIPAQSGRTAKKMNSTFGEVQALYDLGMTGNRIVEALSFCDGYPLDAMPPEVQRLFLITLSMAEVRPQVESYGAIRGAASADPSRMPRSAATDTL